MNTGTDTPNPAVRDARLTDRLEELKGALQAVRAPDGLEARLVDEFRAQAARRRRAARACGGCRRSPWWPPWPW